MSMICHDQSLGGGGGKGVEKMQKLKSTKPRAKETSKFPSENGNGVRRATCGLSHSNQVPVAVLSLGN